MQMTADTRDGLMADISATGATLDPAALWVGVGTAVDQQGLATVLADISQATGAMATRQAIAAWSTTYTLNDGRAVRDGPLLHFKPASSSEGQALAVWFLADALTAGNLVAYGVIFPTVNLPDQHSVWSIVPRITLDPLGRWSAEITYNG